MDVKEKTTLFSIVTTKLAKTGITSLLLGLYSYVLWQKAEKSDEQMRVEIKELKIESRNCIDQYQNLLIKEINETNRVIDKNTNAFEMLINETRENKN